MRFPAPLTRTLAAMLVSAALLTAAYHAVAYASYRGSFDDRPLAARLSSAERAARLEPANRAFEIRRIRLDAERLYLAEDYDAAHALMQPIIASRNGDDEFVAFYQEVSAEWIAWSARKAHLQHGHEGPGGTLRPEDIER